MNLFSGRSKPPQKRSGGKKNHAAKAAVPAGVPGVRHSNGRCRALCCGASRLSVSSSASCSSAEYATEPLPPRGLSSLAHGVAQARLPSMIDAADRPAAAAARKGTEMAERRGRTCRCACACGGGGGYYENSGSCERRPCVVLVAVDRRTSDPREDFRRSIAEVITAKRMAEPAELRALLNCYVSVNAREHRAAILEAFHEVCSGLFSRKC
ncbi:hypothetical protein ABZP36_003074 [Zizania latifolia]